MTSEKGARLEIEKLIGHKVFLGLRVKVAIRMAKGSQATGQAGLLAETWFLSPTGVVLKTCSSVYYLVAAARPK